MSRLDLSTTAAGRELAPRAGDASATIHVPVSACFYEEMIEGLTRGNELMLRLAEFPPIYESGVRYRKEAEDTWRHADDVLCSGWGDCEDLAAWRAAELRVSGEDPDARVLVYRSGPRRFHAVVAMGDGRIEDPSLLLGMKVSEARRRQLPRWEGQTEMDDTTPRQFAACSGCSAGSCANKVQAAGEDILCRGAVGEAGALLTDPPGTSGFWSRVRGLARPRVPRLPGASLTRRLPGSSYLQRVPGMSVMNRLPGVSGEPDDGAGDEGMLGADEGAGIDDYAAAQDQMLLGDGSEGYGSDGEEYSTAGEADGTGDDGYGDGYGDDYGDGYADDYGDGYSEDAAPAEAAPAQGGGPNALERAASATGGAIKDAAQNVWGVVKNLAAPVGSAVRIATAPISLVAQGSKKIEKWANAPVKGLKKIFSFLGGVDAVMPEQVGIVDDDDYVPGDELFWEGEEGGDEEIAIPPESQRPRFRTEQVGPGVWQGQVILPTKEPGKAVTLTTTPAPDESSALERMYNLSKSAAGTPAMMALMNPLAFTTLMLLRGGSKLGSPLKAVGSGITTAAKYVGRGAESIAKSAASW